MEELNQSKKQKGNKQNSKSIWFDVDNDKYYLLDNETGIMKRTNKTGEYIKKFNAKLTGQCDYSERIEQSNGILDYMPMKVKSVQLDKQNMFYTPQNDKLEGYQQFPRPRTLPYFNQEKLYQLKPLRKRLIKQQEEQLKLIEKSHNQNLFNYKKAKKFNLGTTYLSGSFNQYQELQKTNKMRVMNERIPTSLTQSQSNITKLINDRPLLNPIINRFQKTLYKSKSDASLTIKPLQLTQSTGQTIADQKINTNRYTTKVKALDEKTFSFKALPQESQQSLISFYNLESTRDKNIEQMKQRFENIACSTFDNHIKINLRNTHSEINIGKTFKDFSNQMTLARQELEGYKIPVQKEKNTVSSKYRYPYTIITTKAQYELDRDLIIKNFEDEVVEKIEPKKLQQEKFRSECNKIVINESLRNTLKKESQENQYNTLYRR